MKTNPINRFQSAKRLLAVILAGYAMSFQAHAATLTWNQPGANNNWDITATDIWTSGGPWSNTNPDSAIFGTAGETVTLAVLIKANSLTFNVANYIINGSATNMLTFEGADPTITNGVTATINAPIGGSVTKAGAGSLYINTLNPGATFIATAGTTYCNTGGGIKGNLRIGSGATVTNSTFHVFSRPESRIWINGGILTHNGGEYYIPAGLSAADPGVQMTGGQLLGNGAETRFDPGHSYFRVNAASTTAVLNSTINSYNGGAGNVVITTHFEVVGGTVTGGTTPGVDFLCSGNVGYAGWGGYVNFEKTGAGLMEVTGTPVLVNNGFFTLSNGTLRLTGTNAVTNFGGTGVAFGTASPLTLQLNAASSGDNLTFSKNLTGGASATAWIEKIGTGTVTLTGAGNSFAGTAADAVKVTAGTLYLTTAFTTAPKITVNGGTFGGTVATSDVVVNGGGTLEGGKGGTGALSPASLTTNGTVTLRGNLGATPAIAVAGAVTANGGAQSITITPSNSPAAGTYPFLSYGSGPDPFSAFRMSSRTMSLVDNAGAKTIDVSVSATTAYPVWTGIADGNWNTTVLGGPTNWDLNTGGTTNFMTSDSPLFNNTTAVNAVTLTENVAAGVVTFDNDTDHNYTLGGAFGITAGSLVKSGTGSLVISSANSYTGGTTLNNGVLELGSAAAIGAGGTVSMNGGTLRYSTANSTDYSARLRLEDGKTAGFDTNGVNVTLGTAMPTAAGATGSLLKVGPGTLAINAANTFTGGTVVRAGTLTLGNVSAAKAGGAITLGDAVTGDDNITLSANVGSGTFANPITVSSDATGSGTITIGQPQAYSVLSGLITLNRATTFSQSGDRSGIAGKITGPAGTVTFTGNRTTMEQTAGNASDFTGNVVVNGTLQLNSIYALPATASVTVNGGAWFRPISGATINAINGTGTATISNNSGGGAATTPLSIGNANGDGSFSGYLQNGSGADIVSIVKNGTGTQELGGANIKYTGATTLNNGTLTLNGTPAFNSAITMSSANPVTLKFDGATDWTFVKNLTGGASADARIEKAGPAILTLAGAGITFAGTAADALKVTEGALYVDVPLAGSPAVVAGGVLGGNGTVSDTIVQSGAAIEGGHSGSGTLTVGNLTIGAAAIDTATVKGTLAAGATPLSSQNLTLNGGNGTVLLNATGSGLTNGSFYDVIAYSGVISAPNASSPQAVFASNSRAYSPFVNTATKKVQLYYDATATLYWTGIGSTEWSTAASLNNWKLNGTDGIANFQTNDVVIFDNRAAIGKTAVEITEDVSPIGTTVDNNADHPYTLTGTFGIATGALTKRGAGTLTISCFNTYTGTTTLTDGVLEIDSTDALGTGGGIAMNGGTLRFLVGGTPDYSSRLRFEDGKTAVFDTNGFNINCANVIAAGPSATGTLLKTGAGTLTLGGSNTFTGGSVVRAGTLALTNATAAGAGSITLGDSLTDADATTVSANAGSASFANPIVVSADGTGTATISQSQNFSTLSGPITLNRATTINTTAGDRAGISGKITGNVGTLTFTGNRVTLDQTAGSACDFTGNVVVDCQVQTNTIGALPSTASVTVNAGKYFRPIAGANINGLNGTGTVNNFSGGGVATTPLSLGNNGGDGSFAGTLQNGSGVDIMHLIKNGSGTQILGGTNLTYTGATTVNGGTLQIDGAKTGAGAVTVKSAATLAGIGSVSGDTTVEPGGFVAPGNAAIATLTLASGTLAGTYLCQLDAAAGDRVTVTGALTVSPGAAITITTLGTPAADSYIIASYASVSGDLPTITPPSGYAVDTASLGTMIKLVKSGGYSSWAATNAPDQTMGQDHDIDGVSNGIEYFMGLSGSGFTANPAIATNGMISWPKGTSYTGTYGTDYVVETSPDLSIWTPVPLDQVVIDADSVDYLVPKTDFKKFARLKVTGP